MPKFLSKNMDIKKSYSKLVNKNKIRKNRVLNNRTNSGNFILNLCTSKMVKNVDFAGKTSIIKTHYIVPYIPSDYSMDTIYVNLCF